MLKIQFAACLTAASLLLCASMNPAHRRGDILLAPDVFAPPSDEGRSGA